MLLDSVSHLFFVRCLYQYIISATSYRTNEQFVFDAKHSLQPGQRNLKADDVRVPHIFDVVTALAQHMSEGSAPQTMSPKDLCMFMGGFGSEAEEFMRLRPKFFFITCDVLDVKDDVPVWSTESIGLRTPLVVPVILRGGYYYIIAGKENIPVYRIHHPKQFFFSIDGKALLIRMLTKWYCGKDNVLELVHTPDGNHLFYCLPTFTIGDGWPCEVWNDVKLDEVNAIVPFHLVHEPFTYYQKFTVQVVKLNDTTNIVDVRFPDSA